MERLTHNMQQLEEIRSRLEELERQQIKTNEQIKRLHKEGEDIELLIESQTKKLKEELSRHDKEIAESKQLITKLSGTITKLSGTLGSIEKTGRRLRDVVTTTYQDHSIMRKKFKK